MELRPFSPPWWLRSGHAQTLATAFLTGPNYQYQATPRQVALDDGDIVVVHDDCPKTWRPGDRVALLMHGLSGNHLSPLLVRLSLKLTERGARVFRWDLRGCGAGAGLARLPYNAGCSHDLAKVVDSVVSWCGTSNGSTLTEIAGNNRNSAIHEPYLTLFGVSLSGNILLKYLGENPDRVPAPVAHAISVNPPIDLARSVGTLNRPVNRLYDRHFVRALYRDLKRRQSLRPDVPMPAEFKQPKRLFEFDDWYTAPMSGYETAINYYRRCSALQFMSGIRTPTTVITSQDDPMVPFEMFNSTVSQWSPSTRLIAIPAGGHVGYFARQGIDPDPFWLDWRVVDYVMRDRLS